MLSTTTDCLSSRVPSLATTSASVSTIFLMPFMIGVSLGPTGLRPKGVAEAVITHAEKNPRKTLGVGTFSVAQRDAILDEIELQRRTRPDLEEFFAESVPEPFFVKNLETIQGDERDVIFLSVGYGPDENGYMVMSFGPLSSDGAAKTAQCSDLSRSRTHGGLLVDHGRLYRPYPDAI